MNKHNSVEEHENTAYSNLDLNYWREHNLRHQNESVVNNGEIKLLDLLKSNESVRKTAFDIGSGVGWMSCFLSDYFEEVISIEPSSKAIEVSKSLYLGKKNIRWIEGYAESVIDSLEINEPSLFITCSVFQHLEDFFVEKVLHAINVNAPKGSILNLQELWGEETHRNMQHSRTKEWWLKNLSNWDLDFHGPEVLKNINKGIHGIKIK